MQSPSKCLIAAMVMAVAAPAPAAEPSAAAVTAPVEKAAAEKKPVTFDVWEFQITGNTLIDRTQIERTVYPFLGPNKSIDDVDAARGALETLYSNSGFPTVVVNLPEQKVTQGVVTLEVVQGSIDRTRVSGSRYFSLGKIRKGVPALAKGQVPYLPDVRDQLQALNQANGDRQVAPVFRPGRTPGTVEVELQVKDELPLHGSLEVNNHNSPNTTRTRLIGTLSYDNLWQSLHSMSLMYQLSPEKLSEVRVLAGTYLLPIGDAGSRLALYAIRSKSDSEVASAGALSVIGKGSIFGTRWIKPFFSTPSNVNSLTLGLDWKDFNESTVLTGADTRQLPIDYSVFSAQYTGVLLGEAARTSYSVGAHFGLRGLGNSENEFANKRTGATANFAYLSAELDHEQRFHNGMRLVGGLHGKLAGQPLISNEQFSAGGSESVRGYHESEVLGDDGLQASLELHSPGYAPLSERWFGRFNALAFVDGAVVKIQQPLPEQDGQIELYSAGIGVRMRGSKKLEAALDIAWPLTGYGSIDSGDVRVDFMLRTGF